MSIGDNAFAYCYSKGHTYWAGGDAPYEYGLTSITIPKTVTSIGNSAFQGCLRLSKIICLAETPPNLGSSAFDETNDCPIYVPWDYVEIYKAAAGWSTYADRIQPYDNPYYYY